MVVGSWIGDRDHFGDMQHPAPLRLWCGVGSVVGVGRDLRDDIRYRNHCQHFGDSDFVTNELAGVSAGVNVEMREPNQKALVQSGAIRLRSYPQASRLGGIGRRA